VLWLLPRQESLDGAHAAAAAWAGMLWRFGLFGLFGLYRGGLDGVDRDERHCEQRDVVGAGRAGEQAVVTDAVEALWQDLHQEAADELVGIERFPTRRGRRLETFTRADAALSSLQVPIKRRAPPLANSVEYSTP
jgi:hypothetical protein